MHLKLSPRTHSGPCLGTSVTSYYVTFFYMTDFYKYRKIDRDPDFFEERKK